MSQTFQMQQTKSSQDQNNLDIHELFPEPLYD